MSDENPLGIPAKRHINPDGTEGGWVADTATVAPTAHIGANARVCGTARVYGNARVYGTAWVYGIARVYGNAWVYGNAQVSGNAWVSGNAQVSGIRHVLTVGPLGSENQFMTVAPHVDGLDADPVCTVGCWTGRLSELKTEVEARGAEQFWPEYKAARKLARLRQQEWLEATTDDNERNSDD